MYTIGEFSAITGINKKTLRYYDEVTLLNPAKINEDNGYRLYDESQVPTARYILKYKDTGLSLTDIKKLLADDSNMNKILDLRLKDITKEIEKLRQQQDVIKQLQKSKDISLIDRIDYAITERVFESGYILYMNGTFEDDNPNILISEFYNYAAKNECEVISGHYFRKYVDNEDDEKIQIFAYTNNKNSVTSFINDTKTLEIVCSDITQKGKVYEKLINHAKSNDTLLSGFIEEYIISNGKLCVKINGVVEER